MASDAQYIPYFNNNICKSFRQSISTSLVALSAQVCSEVIIYNKTGGDITIYDNNNFSVLNSLLLSNNDNVVIRGITNTNQVSASASSAGTMYYRSQYYSYTPSR
jgi:hypothetical protein